MKLLNCQHIQMQVLSTNEISFHSGASGATFNFCGCVNEAVTKWTACTKCSKTQDKWCKRQDENSANGKTKTIHKNSEKDQADNAKDEQKQCKTQDKNDEMCKRKVKQ